MISDRRRAFAWLDLEALDRIDTHAPEAVAAGVRNVYLALAQMAARRHDGDHDGFDATRQELATLAHTTTKTIDRHVAELERLGLVAIETRTAANGAQLPNRYALVDPPRDGEAETSTPQGHEVAPPREMVSPRGDTGDAAVSPQRARPDAVKKKEERERERAPAVEDLGDQGSGGDSDAEQAVVAELSALLADRGERLAARDRLAIRSAMHATPDGVDPAAAAARLRRNYGPDGIAANRRIGNIVALLITEIQQSSPAREPAPQRTGSRGQRRPTAGARSNVPDAWRVHDPRPTLDPPGRRLTKAWEQAHELMRSTLDRNGHRNGQYLWEVYFEPLRLAGTYVVLQTEAGEDIEQPQAVIVVDAPSGGSVEHVREDRHMRLVVACLENVLGEDGIVVELARRDTAAKGSAVAA